MSVHPRARSIVNHCQREGCFLRKAHVSFPSGYGETAFYLEPGGKRVAAKYAMEAIDSGWLVPRDRGLFDDCPQTWTYQPKATRSHEPPGARHGSAFSEQGRREEENQMVDARKYFGVTFVTLEDLEDGPQLKVIDRTEEGKFGKLNLIFTDNTAVGLNATNSRAMVKAFGAETDGWAGHTVELSAGELEYQGKMNPAIIITPISAAEKTAAANAPAGRVDEEPPF
jgi:hypothetical protein